MRFAVIIMLLLSGCAETAHLDRQQPVATVHSARTRAAVAECLLNRMSGNSIRPERQDQPGLTILRFTSVDQWSNPGLYLFTIRDEGTGSIIEARIPHGFVSRGLPTAQTCF